MMFEYLDEKEAEFLYEVGSHGDTGLPAGPLWLSFLHRKKSKAVQVVQAADLSQ